MNAIDKVIGYFSPERGYRRAQYRAATQVFAYDGAKSGRRTDGWIAAGGDANSEVGASLTALRKLREPNYAVQWTAPKFESVDPLKDAMAELKKIRTGTLTLTEAIAQNGYDPEKQLLEIQRVNALLDEYEIILDCDPRNVNDSRATRGAPVISRGVRKNVKRWHLHR
jgi:hypothetical protein